MTIWSGAAATLVRMKNRWRGTLLMVGQPAEETVSGAKAMLKDGFLARFPRPDFALAVHDSVDLPAGDVSWTEGACWSNVDSADVTLYGKGGHGARPENTVDPVVLSARFILALQTIISREKNPLEPAVITVGSIHGGTRYNIIPDEVKLQLNLRSFSPEVRQQLKTAILRVAKAEAAAASAPREPSLTFVEGQDACWNDPALTRRLAAVLGAALGAGHITQARPDMPSEDFGEFGKAAGAPSVMFRIGAADPDLFQRAKASRTPLPCLHASGFAPDRERTVRTGVAVVVLSALDLLRLDK
jgi:hippurate hydrolase